MIAESLSQKVIRNTSYNALGSFVSVVALIILVPYIILRLGPEMYGLWVIISVTTGYLGLSDFNIGQSFLKFIAEYYALKDFRSINRIINTGFTFCLIVGGCLFALAFLFVGPLFRLLEISPSFMETGRFVFFVAMVNLVAGNALSIFIAALNGMQYIAVTKKVEMGVTVARMLVYVIILEHGFGLKGIIIAETLLTGSSIVIHYVLLGRLFTDLAFRPWQITFSTLRLLLGFGGKLQISRFSELINFQFDRLLVTKFVGLQYVMYADVGGKLLGRLRFFPMMIFSSIIPAISELNALSQPEKIRMAFERMSKYLAVSSLPVFMFCLVFAHPIIRVWFGDSFSIAAYTMQILAVGYLVNVMTTSISYASQGIGNVTPQMWTAVIQTIANIVLGVLLVLHMGYYGIMIATTVSLTAGAMYFAFAFEKILRGSIEILWRAVKVPIIASAMSMSLAILPWLLTLFVPVERAWSAALLILSLVIFLAVYCYVIRRASYFDKWDGEYLSRVSPKLIHLRRLMISQNA